MAVSTPSLKLPPTKKKFKPNVWFTIVMLFLMGFFLSLANWQWQRAKTKQELMQRWQHEIAKGPKTQLPAMITQQQAYQTIKLQGHFNNQQIILLDNKIYQHQQGYQVVRVFYPNNNQTAVLVNQGFIPLVNQARKVLPTIKPIDGEQTINGMLSLAAKNYVIGKNQLSNKKTWPLVLQTIDFSLISNLLKQPIHQYLILQSPQDQTGYIRDWQIVAMPPEKNQGYAVQWLLMAITTGIIYIILSFKREE